MVKKCRCLNHHRRGEWLLSSQKQFFTLLTNLISCCSFSRPCPLSKNASTSSRIFDNSISWSTHLFEHRINTPLVGRGVQVSGTKRGPKSPKFPPKIGFLRGIFDTQLSNTSHTPTLVVARVALKQWWSWEDFGSVRFRCSLFIIPDAHFLHQAQLQDKSSDHDTLANTYQTTVIKNFTAVSISNLPTSTVQKSRRLFF